MRLYLSQASGANKPRHDGAQGANWSKFERRQSDRGFAGMNHQDCEV